MGRLGTRRLVAADEDVVSALTRRPVEPKPQPAFKRTLNYFGRDSDAMRLGEERCDLVEMGRIVDEGCRLAERP